MHFGRQSREVGGGRQQGASALSVQTIFNCTVFLLEKFSPLRTCHQTLERTFAQVFRNFLGARAPNMHLIFVPGRRDLSTVKFSTRYDACSSKKRRKNETQKIENMANFERPFTPPRMAPFGLTLWATAFRMIPDISFFHVEKTKNQRKCCSKKLVFCYLSQVFEEQ